MMRPKRFVPWLWIPRPLAFAGGFPRTGCDPCRCRYAAVAPCVWKVQFSRPAGPTDPCDECPGLLLTWYYLHKPVGEDCLWTCDLPRAFACGIASVDLRVLPSGGQTVLRVDLGDARFEKAVTPIFSEPVPTVPYSQTLPLVTAGTACDMDNATCTATALAIGDDADCDLWIGQCHGPPPHDIEATLAGIEACTDFYVGPYPFLNFTCGSACLDYNDTFVLGTSDPGVQTRQLTWDGPCGSADCWGDSTSSLKLSMLTDIVRVDLSLLCTYPLRSTLLERWEAAWDVEDQCDALDGMVLSPTGEGLQPMPTSTCTLNI